LSLTNPRASPERRCADTASDISSSWTATVLLALSPNAIWPAQKARRDVIASFVI
jgi:hypothetical protein